VNQAEIAAIYQKMLLPVPRAADRSPATWEWDYLMQLLPEDRGTCILDAGCGNGCYSRALAASGYRNVIAIDLFGQVDTQGAFRYQRNSIDAIDLPDQSVEFLFSFSVIYYLPDPLRALREFHRVLKPQATMVLTSHTRHSLFTLKRIIWRAFGKAPHLKGVRFRSTGNYLRMTREAGFELLDADGYRLLALPGFLRRCLPLLGGEPFGQRRTNWGHSPRWLKQLRSVFGYHFAIAAYKPACGRG
jgi:SAM-dependent methyltransferase